MEGKISWVWSSHLGYPQLDWNGVRFLERELRSSLFIKNRIPSSTSLRDWNQNRNRFNLFFKNENRRFFTKVRNRPTLVYTYLIPIQIPGLYIPYTRQKTDTNTCHVWKYFYGWNFVTWWKILKWKGGFWGFFNNAKFYGGF